MDAYAAEILEELKTELSVTSDADIALLTSKLTSAIREIKAYRNYPSSYTETMIAADIEKYAHSIKNLAAYDYSLVGAEYETSHSENGIGRNYADRESCFNWITPISRIF